jgi:hypothetical protein
MSHLTTDIVAITGLVTALGALIVHVSHLFGGHGGQHK